MTALDAVARAELRAISAEAVEDAYRYGMGAAVGCATEMLRLDPEISVGEVVAGLRQLSAEYRMEQQ